MHHLPQIKPEAEVTAQTNNDPVCSTSRVLPFARGTVFEAFADAPRLASWWGPDGFTNTFEVFEFKAGGRWKFVMHGPDGTNYPNESVFLEVSPTRVVIQHVSQPHFTLTVTLSDQGGQTKLTWSQVFADAEVAARIRHIVEPANEQNLSRLHAALSATAT
jgi:uncharacterized protein YndB with AHSA1/START domain